MNISIPNLLVAAAFFFVVLVNGYFMRVGLRDGNRHLTLATAAGAIVFGLVGLAFFAGAFR